MAGDLRLVEHGTAAAGTAAGAALDGVFLDDPAVAADADALHRARAAQVSEGRHGLVVRADRHVGVVRLGPVRLHIRPKLPLPTLWATIAYGLDLPPALHRPPVDLAVDGDLPDLLAAMLLQAAEQLGRAGLHRAYVPREGWLASPRGRPDLLTLQRTGPLLRAALPCRRAEFEADHLLNGVITAGLELAARVASPPGLRSAAHREAAAWRARCPPARLTSANLDAADRQRGRLAAHYAPAHALVRLLAAGSGVADDLDAGALRVPGQLWDMARVFERFVARFLADHLPDVTVDPQATLRALYTVTPGAHGHRAPRPRPDLVLRRGPTTLAVLDTKYTDAWTRGLSRDALYQLSVYAVAWAPSEASPVPAVVLYPSDVARPDIAYALHPASGPARAIVLRAVTWADAAERLHNPAGAPARAALARRWAGLA
jgi:5-methylcytosine-specific restriction endonuclease McrBC regulatory subunit McrC